MAGERSQAPTQHRLDDLRSKGQLPRSSELNTAVAVLACFAILQSYGGEAVWRLYWMLQRQLADIAQPDFTPASLGELARSSGMMYFGVLGPLIAFLPLVGIAASFAQVGPYFSTRALNPDFSRVNPLTGLKRLFSLHSAMELVKTAFKAAIICVILSRAINDDMPALISMAATDLAAAAPKLAASAVGLGLNAGFALLVLAGVDYVYQRWDFFRNARMSTQDIKDEMRQQEGSPEIRQRMRQLQRKMAAGRMMQDVPQATVVITNPTHLAIALQYEAGQMGAPKVVAKGAGFVAQRIREIAGSHGVPVIENKPLAQALFRTVEVGSEIPGSLFQAVAEVLAHIYSLRTRRREVMPRG